MPPQVELGATSRDRPELDTDAQFPSVELSSPWWWEEFNSFLLDGVADICGSQEGGDPEGSTLSPQNLSYLRCVREREGERIRDRELEREKDRPSMNISI